MNRIDTPQAAYQLSRALTEVTGGEVSALTLGRVHPIEGVEGGLQRQMSARIDGEPKRFVAMEVGGKVSIVDASLGLETRKAHEILKRFDQATEQQQAKGLSRNIGTAQRHGQSADVKAPGWPVRNPATAHHSQSVRANTRRR